MIIYNLPKINNIFFEIFIIEINNEFEFKTIFENITNIISNIYKPNKKDNTIIIFNFILHYLNESNNYLISFNNNNEETINILEKDLKKTNNIILEYIKYYNGKKINQYKVNYVDLKDNIDLVLENSKEIFSSKKLKEIYKKS